MQLPFRQYDADHLFEGTCARPADTSQHTDQNILLIEVLDLQIVEALRPVLIGKELDMLLNDRLVFLLNAQIH